MDKEANQKEELVWQNRLRLIRLKRLVEAQQIPAEVVARFERNLLLGASGAQENPPELSVPQSEAQGSDAEPDTCPKSPQNHAESFSWRHGAAKADGDQAGAQGVGILTEDAEKAELILRRLVAAGETWEKMKPYAWEVFDKWPRPEVAAKVTELAYMHGSLDDLTDVLQSIKERVKSFYFLIDADIRCYMVLRLWLARKEAVLNFFLHQKMFQGYLIAIEHFFVFWSLYAGPQPALAWKYFQRHRFELLQALRDYGRRLKLTPGRFYLTVGRLAYDQRDESQARHLLEQIDKNEPEFQEALDMLIKFDVELDENGFCIFGRQLIREKTWLNRVKLFDEFFQQCRRLDGVKHQERAALNGLLAAPLKWLPQNADAWQRLAKVLVKHADLDYLLPNLLQVFADRRFQFEAPPLDKAFWEPLLYLKHPSQAKNLYWRAFAQIHQYVATLGADELLVWQARRTYRQAMELTAKPFAETWGDIHSKLLGFFRRSSRLEESKREQVLRQLKVVGNYLDVQREDIRNYLAICDRPNDAILSELQNLVRQREDWPLEVELLEHITRGLHYRNQDLARLWVLARHQRHFDLGWRVASVLAARDQLHQDVNRVWALTAERRHERGLLTLQVDDAATLLEHFEGEERQFLEAFWQIGPLLPELLAVLSRQVKAVRRSPPESSWAKSIEQALERSTVWPAAKKIYRNREDGQYSEIPPFADLMPDNRWASLWIAVAERFGLYAWRWQLSVLHGELEGLLSKLNRSKDLVLPARVGKWLRGLTPAQRKSWYDLGVLSKRLSDERGYEILGSLVSRVSTLLSGQHLLGLQSLAAMGAPVRLRWDLERFILSQGYSIYRRNRRVALSLEIPETLPQDPRQR